MDKQIIIFELNLRKEQWLVVSVYKPPAQDATYFLNWLSQIIDIHSIIYGKQVIIQLQIISAWGSLWICITWLIWLKQLLV